MTHALTLHTVYVEGEGDLGVLSRWFPEVQFKKAEGKDRVRSQVEGTLTDCGVLDRDFATDEQVTLSCEIESRVVILSRYCIENYLLEPEIIAAALARLDLAVEHPARAWLDETTMRQALHSWGSELALYAAANEIVAQWRERITLDRELGFLHYFGPLPPISREEVLESLHRRLAALTPLDEVDRLLDNNYHQIIEDTRTWGGLHRWINGKVLLEKYLYPQVFEQTRLSQSRVRDLLIEVGCEHIPAELQELSHRWCE